MSQSLRQSLFSPQSVAIVGQSDDVTKTAGRPLKYLRQAGFGGRIYPINPRRKDVLGERAYPSLAALPEVPEHVYVVAPTEPAIEAVAECGRLGVKVATVLADGFAEAGPVGEAREARLKPRVVDLDASLQWLAGVPFHHHLRQLVLDLPGGGLRHPEAAGQFDAGDALLALRQVIHRPEPDPQRQMGRREDRAGDRRGLAAAGVALEQPAGRQLAVRPPAAGRANEAIRPARGDHHGAAFLLGAVAGIEVGLTQALLKLHLVPCHRHPTRHPNVRIMYQAWEAEKSA